MNEDFLSNVRDPEWIRRREEIARLGIAFVERSRVGADTSPDEMPESAT
jgi:hypothetical protein